MVIPDQTFTYNYTMQESLYYLISFTVGKQLRLTDKAIQYSHIHSEFPQTFYQAAIAKILVLREELASE